MKTSLNSKSGFTLIEVIAVLVLLGILAAVAVPKYIDLTASAGARAVDAAVAELNGREAVAWADQMLQTSGASVDDSAIQALVGTDLGGDFTLAAVTAGTEYTVTFNSVSYDLGRTVATSDKPGHWTNNGLTTP